MERVECVAREHEMARDRVHFCCACGEVRARGLNQRRTRADHVVIDHDLFAPNIGVDACHGERAGARISALVDECWLDIEVAREALDPISCGDARPAGAVMAGYGVGRKEAAADARIPTRLSGLLREAIGQRGL